MSRMKSARYRISDREYRQGLKQEETILQVETIPPPLAETTHVQRLLACIYPDLANAQRRENPCSARCPDTQERRNRRGE